MWFKRAHLPLAAVATVGLGLSAALFVAVWAYDNNRTSNAFNRAAEEVMAAVERRVQRAFDVLLALDGLSNVSESMPRDAFRIFAEPFLDDSLFALGWAPAGTDINGDKVRDLVPLYAVEPAEAFWQGMDLNGDPDFRRLVARARATGETVATPPEPEGMDGAPYPMAVLLKPVGPAGAPDGYVLVALRLDTLADAALEAARRPAVSLTLSHADDPARAITAPTQSAPQNDSRALRLTREFPFADQPWRVEVRPLPDAYVRGPSPLAFICALIALTAVGMLSAYIVQRERNTVRLRTLAERLHVEAGERRKVEQQLHALAHHDALTGLANRRLFEEHVSHALAHAQRAQEGVALLYLDLDGFKAINDELGHDVGDATLRAVAARMSEAVRAQDHVARLGGDEFAILLPDVSEPEDAVRVAEKVATRVGEPLLLAGASRRVTTSIGISLYPEHARTAEQLLRHGDEAMYCAKRGGKNRHCVYGMGVLHPNPTSS